MTESAPSHRLRRLATFAVLILTAALAVLGARGFDRKLETFQPLGFEAVAAGDHWQVRSVGAALSGAPGANGLVLQPGDRIVLVNGEAGASRDLAKTLRSSPQADLVVLRGERLETIAYTRPPLDLDTAYLVLALIGCGYLAVGLYLLWRSEQSLLFYLWCLASAVLYVYSPVFPPDRVGRWIFFGDEAARLLLPPLTLHLFLSIPRNAATKAKRWIPYLYLPAAALLALQTDLAFFGGRFVAGAPSVGKLALLDRIELAHLLVFAGLAIAVLSRRLAKLSDWEQHRQILWLTVGMAAGYLPFFLFHGLPALAGWRLPEAVSTLAVLPLACVPLAFAWAVLRYRLWDLGVMVRDGVSYGLTAIFAITSFSLIDLALRRTIPENLAFAREVATFFGGLLIVGLILPTQRGLHGAIERLQYGSAFGRRRGLARVGQELLEERDLDRLCTALLAEMVDGLDLGRANLLLLQGAVLIPVRPEPGLPRGISLATLRDDLWEDEFETLSPVSLPGEPASGEQLIFGAGYRYCFPLAVRGSRIGLAVTTLRKDHLPLSSEDVEIARSLLDQAALAIENAQLLDQVQRQLERVSSLQRHNQDILESSPAGIAVLDPDDRVASANLAFAALVGRPRAELTGRKLVELLPITTGIPEATLADLPAPGIGLREISFIDDAGQERQLQLSMAPMAPPSALGAGDDAGRRVVVVQDVTERAQLERALKEQDRLASLGVLAAGVAHEVNTPLTGISSYAQMLLAETASDDPRRELLEKVERQTFRASRIVNNLLDFARKRDHEVGDVELSSLIGETIDLVRERFASRKVRLDWTPPAAPVHVQGAEGELQQVLTNLLLNALDATAERGSEVRVRLNAATDDPAKPASAPAPSEVRQPRTLPNVKIVVEDDGPGIRDEHLPKIFEPFFTTKSGQGGTGLGLAISRQIVEQHGGRIEAENRAADVSGTRGVAGCRFTVELPAAASPGAGAPAAGAPA